MARLTQRSYLGDAWSRLQRSLDLDGLAELGLEDGIVPIVLVDDATKPGGNPSRGRRWRFALTGHATGQNIALTPATNQGRIIVDRFEAHVIGGGAGDVLNLYQYQAGTAAPVVPSGNGVCQFAEDYRGDLAPVFVATGAGIPTVQPIGVWNLPAGAGVQITLDMGVLAPCILTWRWVAAVGGTLNLTVAGRVF